MRAKVIFSDVSVLLFTGEGGRVHPVQVLSGDRVWAEGVGGSSGEGITLPLQQLGLV